MLRFGRSRGVAPSFQAGLSYLGAMSSSSSLSSSPGSSVGKGVLGFYKDLISNKHVQFAIPASNLTPVSFANNEGGSSRCEYFTLAGLLVASATVIGHDGMRPAHCVALPVTDPVSGLVTLREPEEGELNSVKEFVISASSGTALSSRVAIAVPWLQ